MGDPQQAEARTFDSPFDTMVGLQLLSATAELVVGRVDVTDKLFQPTGIVHGGVFATLVETTASVGASLACGGVAVGVNNTTDFLRAVRGGTLHVEARPVHVGRSLQLWHAQIRDDDKRLVAEGRVRLMNLRD